MGCVTSEPYFQPRSNLFHSFPSVVWILFSLSFDFGPYHIIPCIQIYLRICLESINNAPSLTHNLIFQWKGLLLIFETRMINWNFIHSPRPLLGDFEIGEAHTLFLSHLFAPTAKYYYNQTQQRKSFNYNSKHTLFSNNKHSQMA